jgi:hypothetical protein
MTNPWKAVASNRLSLTDTDEKANNDLRNTSLFLGGVAVVGILALSLWASARTGKWPSEFAFGLLIMGSAGLVGGVIGLLFGIPKSISDPSSAASPTANNQSNLRADDSAAGGRRSSYTVNTNLEQISDWLTKIIVGVGLTEIPSIRDQFFKIAAFCGDGFISGTPPTASAAAPVVAAVIIIYGLTAGFLAGYLFTRIFLPGAFERVDSALRRRNTELVSQIAEVRESTEAAGRMQGEIYNDLYRYNSEGFRDVIRKINELFDSPANLRNPALWVYLAAAHGQAYRWESEKRADADPEKKKLLAYHRDQALHAVTTALLSGDDWKPVLQFMWDKHHPTKEKEHMGEDEDDLEVFYDDQAFKELLG